MKKTVFCVSLQNAHYLCTVNYTTSKVRGFNAHKKGVAKMVIMGYDLKLTRNSNVEKN